MLDQEIAMLDQVIGNLGIEIKQHLPMNDVTYSKIQLSFEYCKVVRDSLAAQVLLASTNS